MKISNFRLRNIFLGLLIAAVTVFLIFVNFIHFNCHFNQNGDDPYLADCVRELLEGKCFYHAAGKPMIVLLAALFHLNSPDKIIYLFAFFGLITFMVLFFLAFFLLKDFIISAIVALLWFSSPFYFYFAKSQHLMFIAIYLLAILFCLYGLKDLSKQYYYGGCFLLACSLLTHPSLLVFIPILFLYFFLCFFQKGYKVFFFIKKTIIPFLLVIFTYDFGVLFLDFLFHPFVHKIWPMTYFWYDFFFIRQLIKQSNLVYGFFYHFKIFYDLEWKFISFLIIVSFIYLLYFLLRNVLKKKIYFLDVCFVLFCLLMPFFILYFRLLLGQFSPIRFFLPIIPFLYLLIGFFVKNIFSKRFHFGLFLVFLVFFVVRAFDNKNLQPELETGYNYVVEFLNNSVFDFLIFYDSFYHFRSFNFYGKKVLLGFELDSECNNFPSKRNLFKVNIAEIFKQLRLHKRVAFVVKGNPEDCKKCLIKFFEINIVNIIKSPYMLSRFTIEEVNFLGINFASVYLKKMSPYFYIFELKLKDV